MNFKYIDAHAHVNFAAYDEDRSEVIERALNEGVAMINVGTQKDTSKEAVELSEQYEAGVYAIIGLHPIHTGKSFHDKEELGGDDEGFTSRGEVFDKEYYRELATNKKVVGIGECGLDYFRAEKEDKDTQTKNFISQIELADELSLPLMLHVRPKEKDDAYLDALAILDSFPNVKGNSHFFAGSKETAKKFLKRGFTLSFTGVITFTKDYDELVRYVSLENMLIETDCPYVTPAPHRGHRNEPRYVKEVAKKIAVIKNLPLEQVEKKVFENTREFFGLVDL